jgi:uncharacterized protein YqgC (DUF456 family)
MAIPADVYLVAAIVLLVLAVIGSVVPLIPGAGLSVLGVLLYWWSTGYTDPGLLFVIATVVVGVATVLVDYFAGAISAKMGGATNMTTIIAAGIGLLLFFVAGPFGVIIGVAVTVFLVEFYRTRQVEDSMDAALYATAGLLASTAVQLVITVSILIGFLLAVFV